MLTKCKKTFTIYRISHFNISANVKHRIDNKASDGTFIRGNCETLSYSIFCILVIIFFKTFNLKNNSPIE